VSVAYIDSSCIVALAFDEPGARRIAQRCRAYSRLVAANLLEAEVRAVLAREEVQPVGTLFEGISWLYPDRPLGEEMARALEAGKLRGADLWHLACALYLDPTAKELSFLTLDGPQQRVAAALGFKGL
jgi:predicted nucleic acid-binding protein